MLSATQFQRALGDIDDLLRAAKTDEDLWLMSQKITQDLGGVALNAARTSGPESTVVWARSGMSANWLDHYQSANYVAVDPFMQALRDGASHYSTQCAGLAAADAPCKQAYALNHEMHHYGYGSVQGNIFGKPENGAQLLLVHCSESTLAKTQKDISTSQLSVVHAMIAAWLQPAVNPIGPGILIGRNDPLTARERDILCWLACGLRNEQIADKAGIAEITVRKHLLSVRTKLGAATREQAVALALRNGWIEP